MPAEACPSPSPTHIACTCPPHIPTFASPTGTAAWAWAVTARSLTSLAWLRRCGLPGFIQSSAAACEPAKVGGLVVLHALSSIVGCNRFLSPACTDVVVVQARKFISAFGGALVEEFIAGREFTVSGVSCFLPRGLWKPVRLAGLTWRRRCAKGAGDHLPSGHEWWGKLW